MHSSTIVHWTCLVTTLPITIKRMQVSLEARRETIIHYVYFSFNPITNHMHWYTFKLLPDCMKIKDHKNVVGLLFKSLPWHGRIRWSLCIKSYKDAQHYRTGGYSDTTLTLIVCRCQLYCENQMDVPHKHRLEVRPWKKKITFMFALWLIFHTKRRKSMQRSENLLPHLAHPLGLGSCN